MPESKDAKKTAIYFKCFFISDYGTGSNFIIC